MEPNGRSTVVVLFALFIIWCWLVGVGGWLVICICTGREPSLSEAALLTGVPSPRRQANESLALSPERRTASISRGLVVIGLSKNVLHLPQCGQNTPSQPLNEINERKLKIPPNP